ncbi:MAG: CARDB domain-containing protein [archaeon]
MAKNEKSNHNTAIAIVVVVTIFIILIFFGRSLGYTARFHAADTTQMKSNLPNLVPTGVSVEGKNGEYIYTANVKNTGGLTTGQFTASLSSVESLYSFSEFIGTCIIWYLDPGMTDFCTVKSSVAPKMIAVTVDSTGLVKESNEADNRATF